jgi:hypothetical protein
MQRLTKKKSRREEDEAEGREGKACTQINEEELEARRWN